MKQRWIWVISVAIFIAAVFTFSSSPLAQDQYTIQFLKEITNLSDERINILGKIIRKTVHMLEFGLAAIIFRMALPERPWTNLGAWFSATLLGIADEIHQIYVPGRTPLISDVFLDSLGAFLALFMLFIVKNQVGKDR